MECVSSYAEDEATCFYFHAVICSKSQPHGYHGLWRSHGVWSHAQYRSRSSAFSIARLLELTEGSKVVRLFYGVSSRFKLCTKATIPTRATTKIVPV